MWRRALSVIGVVFVLALLANGCRDRTPTEVASKHTSTPRNICYAPNGDCECWPGTYGVWPACSDTPPDSISECRVAVPDYKQTDPRWGALRYDHQPLPRGTIEIKGCAMTSLTILLAAGGLQLLPSDVNERLVASGGFDPGGGIAWPAATRNASQGQFRFQSLSSAGSDPRTTLAAAVCAGDAVIVRVNNPSSGNSHFVVVNRTPRAASTETPWDSLGISDPGYRSRSSLLPYGGVVAIRGTVRPMQLAPAGLRGTLRGGFALLGTEEELTIHGTGLYFIVTDAQGRRVGRMGVDSAAFTEVPGSSFDDNVLPEEHNDSLGATTMPKRVFEVIVPVEASQTLTIQAVADTTLGASEAWLWVNRSLAQGQSSENSFPLAISKGQKLTWRLQYDVDPTTVVSLERSDAAAPRAFQLTALCGTRFRVRNRMDRSTSANWDVYGTSETGTLILPPRPSGTVTAREYSEMVFETVHRGTVRLFVNGKQVDVKAPNPSTCQP